MKSRNSDSESYTSSEQFTTCQFSIKFASLFLCTNSSAGGAHSTISAIKHISGAENNTQMWDKQTHLRYSTAKLMQDKRHSTATQMQNTNEFIATLNVTKY
jgi:hypothetical protein